MKYRTGETPAVGDYVTGGRWPNYPMFKCVEGVVLAIDENDQRSIQVEDQGILDWGRADSFAFVRKATEQELADAL